MRAEGGGVDLQVGFMLEYAEVVKAFAFEKAEVSHEEDRFDPKSGKKTETEKVVDSEGGTWVRLNGVECNANGEWHDGELEPFFEELGAHLGCGVSTFGGGELGMVAFNLVGDDANVPNTSYDPHQDWSVGSALDLEKLAGLWPELNRVARKMRELGLQPSKPSVFAAMVVQD